MTAKVYIDTNGYWISPDRTIRRISDEGGEQQIIVKATEECSDAEWNRICDALMVSLFKMGEGRFEMPKHIAVGSTVLAQAKSGWSVSLKFKRSDPVGGSLS
jgi:hypothetical protein